ncbi:MAG TPA: hypothetical protein VJC16_00780 [Candidatus Nanoarchaeia archaeon]|nr:hypothetical protein [Candidatus Nanoarchaeia archaeon]
MHINRQSNLGKTTIMGVVIVVIHAVIVGTLLIFGVQMIGDTLQAIIEHVRPVSPTVYLFDDEDLPAAYLARIDSVLQLARREEQQLTDRFIDLALENGQRAELDVLVGRWNQWWALVQDLEVARRQVQAFDALFRGEVQHEYLKMRTLVQQATATFDSLRR